MPEDSRDSQHPSTSPSPMPGPPPPYPGPTPTGQGQLSAYRQPPQFVAVPPKDTSGTNAVVGLVMGILGLLVCWIPLIGIVAWVLSGLGLLFSVLGYRQNNASRVMSLVGIILNGLALLVCCGYVAVFIAALVSAGSTSP